MNKEKKTIKADIYYARPYIYMTKDRQEKAARVRETEWRENKQREIQSKKIRKNNLFHGSGHLC